MKSRLIKILMPLSLVLLFLVGCGNAKVEVPREVTDGYMSGDYETYAEAAKVNGKKYDKLYVVGKFAEEPFEDGELLSCYFYDESNRKYLLKMDTKKTELKTNYMNLKNKQICACGVYGGSLKKERMPVIYTNKIYDIKDKKTLVSQYYGEYYGDFDENGKVVSTDYDEDDNTTIDFHSIQLQVPYNYMEAELNDLYGLYQVQNDGMFLILYCQEDLSKTLSDIFKKNNLKNKMKSDANIIINKYNNIFGEINITNIRDDSYNSMLSFDIENNNMNGHGACVLKDDGYYLITLLSEKTSRFNRMRDFIKIEESLKKLNPYRKPKSTGINKMTVPEYNTTNNTSKVEDKSKNNASKETSKPIETKANNNTSNSGINGVVDEYKKDIDDAKSQLNDEIDKAADQLKDEMGLAGDLFGGYIDKYSDAYKKAIDTVGDAYKDVADDYGKAYQDILDGLGY